MQSDGRLIFVPCGGGDIGAWTNRFEPTGLSEFHLYDREAGPETELRQAAVDAANSRANVKAFLTDKRSIENYLHPDSIEQVFEVRLRLHDDTSVADAVARALLEQRSSPAGSESIRGVRRKRLLQRIKWHLNTRVVDAMTCEQIDECDQDGEVRVWLTAVAELLGSS
jgi:putative ATP-dependent endonuclease of OLD family